MSLDLGALIARVVLDTSSFDRSSTRVEARMRALAATFQQGAAGAGNFDRSMAAAAQSTSAAATSMDRAAAAATKQGAAEQKAAVVSDARAQAQARVAAVLAETAGASDAVQRTALRQLAADSRLTEVTAATTAETRALAAETRRLASAQASAIGAASTAAKAQDTFAASSSRARTVLTGTLRTATELGLFFAGFEAVKKVIDISKEAARFQSEMLLIRTTTGASQAEVNQFSKAILAMAGDVATAPEQLATSLYHVYAVGLRGAQALDVVRIAAEGAKVGNADLEQTTNALTATVASGIKGVQNMGQAMGALVTIVGSGDMKLKDLNEALGSGILAVAKAYNISLTEVGAVLATFGDNNIRGADAATKLRMSIMDIAKPAAGADKVLSRINLTSSALKKALEKDGLTGALDLLSSHMTASGITAGKVGPFIAEAFTKRAGAGLAVLLTQMDRYHSKVDDISKGAETFGDRWTATTHSISFQFASLTNAAKAAGIGIAERAMPVLATLARELGTALPAAVHAVMGVLSSLGFLWTGLTVALGLVGIALKAVVATLGFLTPALQAVAGPVAALWLAFKGYAIAKAALAWLADAALIAKAYGASSATTAAVVTASAAEEASAVTKSNAAIIASNEAVIASNAAVAETNTAVAASTVARGGSGLFAALAGAGKVALGVAALGIAINAVTDSIDRANTIEPTNNGVLNMLIGKVHTVDADLSKAPKLFQIKNPNAGLPQDVQKALADAASSGSVVGSIDKTAEAIGVGTDAAKQYAATLGVVADKNGLVRISQDELNRKVKTTSDAYSTANQTVDEYLKAVDAFAKSAGGAADRAALIGATLKAANGDALNFTGAMASAYGATYSLVDAFRQQDQAITSARKSLQDAQNSGKDVTAAQQQLSDALAASERSVIDLKTGTIDYTKQAAGPLIQQLQAIQTAAMGAAEAQYQHELATKGGVKAADDAYNTYVARTRGALIDQAKQLGLTSGQAQKLADQYFGMPKDVKTQIEQQGADPILDVLNKIGELLARATHQPWTVTVNASVSGMDQILALQNTLNNVSGGRNFGISVNNLKLNQKAAGGTVVGPGTGTSDSVPIMASNGEFVVRAAQAAKHRGLLEAINSGRGFANGGLVATTTTSTKSLITDTAQLPGVRGVATLIAGQVGPAAAAMRLLSQAVNDAFDLRGIAGKISNAKAELTSMQQYKSTVVQTLQGAFDPTKYGSVADLETGLLGATGVNRAYTAELNTLHKRVKFNSPLGKFIDQLAAQGQTATLQTIAGASSKDLANLAKSVGAYNASLGSGGEAAVVAHFGRTTGQQSRDVAALISQQSMTFKRMDALLAAISRLSGRPVEVSIDGKVVGRTVVEPYVIHVLDELNNNHLYRRG